MTVNHPRVIIGLPVYNGELFLREAIISLLNQDYPNYEIIISDNASTDSTERICQEFACNYSKIRYVKQSSNIGPNKNFMTLLDMSNSKYFCWAACDDLWAPNWLSTLVVNFTERDICLQGVVYLSDSNGSKDDSKKIKLPNLNLGSIAKTFMQDERLWRSVYIYGLYDLAKLKLAQLDKITNDYWAAEAMISNLLKYGSFRCIDDTYFVYRDNPVSQGKSDATKYSSFFRKLIWPIRSNYLADVLRPQSISTKCTILLLFPCKQFKVVVEGIMRKIHS